MNMTQFLVPQDDHTIKHEMIAAIQTYKFFEPNCWIWRGGRNTSDIEWSLLISDGSNIIVHEETMWDIIPSPKKIKIHGTAPDSPCTLLSLTSPFAVSAHFFESASTTAAWPFFEAKCSGVCPSCGTRLRVSQEHWLNHRCIKHRSYTFDRRCWWNDQYDWTWDSFNIKTYS